ncbi:MAG: hypothetical protein WC435_02085 [Candidatus Paceibacterota bacterium]
MLKLSKIQIDERLAKLPSLLQDALFDYDIFEKIDNLEKNFNLNEGQSAVLEKIFGRVTMGFIPLSDLEKEVASGLPVPVEDAKKISATLNRDIFASLKGEIDKIGQSKMPSSPVPPENVVNLKKVPVVSPLNKIVFSEQNASQTVGLDKSLKPIPPVFNKQISPAPAPLSPFLSPKPASSLPVPKPMEQIISKPSPFSPLPSAPFIKPIAPPLADNLSSKIAPIQKDFIRPVSPFMIHEESKVEPVFRSGMVEKKAVPEMSSSPLSKEIKQEAVVARVEIGKTRREERKEKIVSPVTAKTEQENRQAIDYSGFPSGPVDPFSKIKSVSVGSVSIPAPTPLKKEEKPLPPPAPPSKEKLVPPSGPSLKGNIVDFRG